MPGTGVITSYSIHYTKLYEASAGDVAGFLRERLGGDLLDAASPEQLEERVV